MRWPFRRKRETTETPVAPAVSAAPAASGVALPARQWAALPAIPVTITRGAPLVAGPAPVLPPLRPATGKAPEVAPSTGSVTGIARPVVRASEPVAEEVPAAPLPPAPVVRRPARPVAAEAPVLTDAVDEYVGAPRVAAEPYRAPDWLRYATNPGMPVFPGLPGPEPEAPIAEPPSFLPPELRNAPEPPAPTPASSSEPPPRMVEGVDRAEAPAQRAMRQRKPSLGQTRRLGLGAPIQAPSRDALIHPEAPPRVVDGTVEPATPQEPPPPPAAPVRVATEQAPEPEPEPEPEPDPEPVPQPAPVPLLPPPPPAPPTSSASSSTAVRPNPPGAGPAPEKRVTATAFRATAQLLPPRKPKPLPRATVVDRVPADLAHAVRAHQHADVANVPVYRGQKVGEAAKARGAKAFASGGAVFLPDEAGPADSQRARGLLAHELVHAVQQRTLGTVLPSPDSPLGQQLEAEAQAAERFYSGESGAPEPPPLIHAPHPAAAAQESEPDLSAPAQLFTAPAQSPAPVQQVQSPFDAATKAEVGKIAEESARHVVTEWTNPKLEPKQGGTTGTHAQARPAFDRAARKEEMVRQTLEVINQERSERGEEPLTDLDPVQYERIERQLDDLQNGTTSTPSTSSTPRQPRYRANSKEAWIHGLTGLDPNQGLGFGGLTAEPGSEKSWFQGAKDDRPLAQRLMTGLGLATQESASAYDSDTWFQDDKGTTAGQQGAGQQNAAAQQRNAEQSSSSGAATEDEEPIPAGRLDLDELSDRLYDRLRTRLRLELLVDRERAGLLTDFR
jgi:hypothetical protein